MSTRRPPPRTGGELRRTSQARIAGLLADAVAQHRAGHLEQAAAAYRRILNLDPQHADALHLSGLLAHQRGQNDRARRSIEQAIDREPRAASFRTSLAAVMLALNLPGEAEAELRRALALDPLHAEAFNNLGNALQQLARTEEALAAYDQAVQLRPAYAEAWCNRGRVLYLAGRAVDAVASLRQALALRPGWAKAYRYLGEALAATGAPAEAEAQYRQALSLAPDDAETQTALASLLERQNRLDDALAAAEAAIGDNPVHARAILTAARCERRLGRLDNALRRLDLLAGADTDLLTTASASFERGQILDRLQRFRAAYDAFVEANRQLAETPAARQVDRDFFPRLIERLTARVTPAWIAAWPPPPPEDRPSPIFLIGFPRSGTTLLDQILDAHPRLRTMEEKDALDHVRRTVDRLPGGYPDALAGLDGKAIDGLRRRYFTEVARHVGELSGRLLVDKMPLNTIDAALIGRLFPGARLLLAIRHPCDVVLSGFMQAMQPNAAMVLFDSLRSTAEFYAQVMGLWRQYEATLPLAAVTIRYEDLVADFDGQTRQMLDFLELPWDDAVRDYAQHAQSRAIATPSYHQVVQPIYRRSVGRWRNYAFAFDEVIPMLAPFIESFGYDPS